MSMENDAAPPITAGSLGIPLHGIMGFVEMFERRHAPVTHGETASALVDPQVGW